MVAKTYYLGVQKIDIGRFSVTLKVSIKFNKNCLNCFGRSIAMVK